MRNVVHFMSLIYRFSLIKGISSGSGRGVRKNKYYDYVYAEENKGGWDVKKKLHTQKIY